MKKTSKERLPVITPKLQNLFQKQGRNPHNLELTEHEPCKIANN